MHYSNAYVREHLPKEDPPLELVPGDVEDEIRNWIKFVREDGELVARATRWTYAVFSELGLGRFRIDRPFLRRSPEGFWHIGGMFGGQLDRVSFGLFDEETEQAGIGITVDVPQWQGPAFLVVDYVSFPRLNEQRFPIAIRQSEVDLHLSHVSKATSACWAQCKLNSSIWGILTAGHAVGGNRPGRSVAMASGGPGTLHRSYFQPVDAAFVKLGSAPSSPSPLSVLAFPSLSMPATVHCQSGSTSRSIVQVTNNCGVLNTRSIGVLIYLDQPEKAGDSGALVTIANGDAVGIYTGRMNVPGAPSGVRGLAQNFEQAVFALDVIPYL